MAPDLEYKVATDKNKYFSSCRNIDLFGRVNRKLLQERTTHMSYKRKPQQVPRTVHDHVLHDLILALQNINVSYGGGNDGDMVASQGRNKLYHAMERMQYIIT
jgi:hypothetical protein